MSRTWENPEGGRIMLEGQTVKSLCDGSGIL